MNRKLLANLTIVTVAGGGLALAGDIMPGKKTASNVQIVNGEILNCEQVNCSGVNRNPFPPSSFIQSAGSASTEAPAWTPQANYASSVSSSFDLQRLSSLTSLDPATAADSTAPTISSAPSSGTNSFALSGNQVMGIAVSSAPVSSLDSMTFSNPVISPAFNLNSTVVVVTAPSSGANTQTSQTSPTSSPLGAGSYTSGGTSYLNTSSTSDPTSDPAPLAPSSNSSTSLDFRSFSAFSAGGTGIAAPQGMTGIPSDAPEPASDFVVGAGLIAVGVFTRVARQSKQ